ncbi:hypothetical protein [Winogradskyella luteola]|uniref:Uncharacterized protein n=1 Tax=Winogradskyella luteola TaxID=2828330 RepID=A0A9X1FAJ0_9FLAO|nr:hypothetical protein [Winogradskyella luteola]MBV7270164.1 hypothetical protein [Winogradskyella luteola]
MKSILKFSLIALSITLASSCDSDDNNEEQQSNPTHKISFSGSSSTDSCDVDGTYSIGVEFVSDGNSVGTNSFNGTTNFMQLSEQMDLAGNTIGIKLTLLNFDANNSNSGRGSGLESIVVNIEDLSNNISILNESLENLFICTDSVYEVVLLYNTADNTSNINYLQHGF